MVEKYLQTSVRYGCVDFYFFFLFFFLIFMGSVALYLEWGEKEGEKVISEGGKTCVVVGI